MIDSCMSHRQELDRSGRYSVLLLRPLMAVFDALPLRCMSAMIVAGLGLMAHASFAAVPVAGAGASDPERSIRLDKSPAPREQAADQSGITSPATGSSVSGSVPILGTAVASPFARYELYYKREPSGDEAYSYFGGDTRQVHNGQLGVWHTGALPPGIYTLRMRVVFPNANYGEFFARNINVNQEAETPTPDAPTPTPIPIDTPTPFPQPTVAPVQVEQPNIEDPSTEPASTTAPIALDNGGGATAGQASAADQSVVEQSPGVLGDLGEALSLDSLRARFFTGVRWSAGLFLLLAAIFAAKRLLEWVTGKAD